MTSFFEKLKKGMGVEIPEKKLPEKEIEEETEEEIKPVSKKRKQVPEGRAEPIRSEVEKIEKPEIEISKIESPAASGLSTTGEREFTLENLGGQEGQLAVDVYQTEEELVIQSVIAGVRAEELDISIENDFVLIRGERKKPEEKEEINYFYQECYWGPFSRQIILPTEADPSRAEATMKEGVLTIRIPKIERKKKRIIEVKR